MKADQQMPIALAIKLGIPWDHANRKIKFKTQLVTEDGQPAILENNPLVIEGEIEVGRPPGIRPGSTLDAVLSIRFPALMLPKGGYSFIFEADGTEAGRVSFESVDTP